jgi:hypothetical protein
MLTSAGVCGGGGALSWRRHSETVREQLALLQQAKVGAGKRGVQGVGSMFMGQAVRQCPGTACLEVWWDLGMLGGCILLTHPCSVRCFRH